MGEELKHIKLVDKFPELRQIHKIAVESGRCRFNVDDNEAMFDDDVFTWGNDVGKNLGWSYETIIAFSIYVLCRYQQDILHLELEPGQNLWEHLEQDSPIDDIFTALATELWSRAREQFYKRALDAGLDKKTLKRVNDEMVDATF